MSQAQVTITQSKTGYVPRPKQVQYCSLSPSPGVPEIQVSRGFHRPSGQWGKWKVTYHGVWLAEWGLERLSTRLKDTHDLWVKQGCPATILPAEEG